MGKSFEDLEVWKRSCRQALEVYKILQNTNDYSLKTQMERAAVSVPSNIAEGQERDSIPEFRRFLRIAKGSNAELRTQLYLATKLGLITKENSNELTNESKQISRMLQGLIQSFHTEEK
jgi:four helix bundle protein